MYKNKKILTLAILSILLLGSCMKNDENSKETDVKEGEELKKIVVASHTPPMTDMIEMIKEDVKKEGYEIELMKVSDNVQANLALANKEADANFFQHELFMQIFNEKNEANLVSVQPVYNAIVAFYGRDIKEISDLKDGSKIGIPNDPTNMARALRLLASYDMIQLKDKESYSVTIEDIVDNPKNFEFKAISLLNLNEAYNELDLIFNYPTYISKIGIEPGVGGIMQEDADDKFAITLVAREDNKDSDMIKILSKHLKGEKIQKFIEEKLKNHAIKAF